MYGIRRNPIYLMCTIIQAIILFVGMSMLCSNKLGYASHLSFVVGLFTSSCV
jgi:hypothetical protein